MNSVRLTGITKRFEQPLPHNEYEVWQGAIMVAKFNDLSSDYAITNADEAIKRHQNRLLPRAIKSKYQPTGKPSTRALPR